MARGLTRLIALLVIAAVTSLSSGCAGISSRAKALDSVTRAYEKHIRWGKFEEARAFHDEYGIENTFMDQQKWVFDAASEHWFLESPIPNFR